MIKVSQGPPCSLCHASVGPGLLLGGKLHSPRVCEVSAPVLVLQGYKGSRGDSMDVSCMCASRALAL